VEIKPRNGPVQFVKIETAVEKLLALVKPG
jgi:hypothetical protein